MSAWAVYNEIDEYAAAWLRNLIAAGHIAPGEVDQRSIEDVRPDDYRGFRQVHLFAGIGIWSAALRRVGWGDDQPIWSCSCPCQPFSAAGAGAGFADERHLWPAAFHLITHLSPERIVGEQVASPDGLTWLDLVQTDLEGADYAPRALDSCSAGYGAPNLRQRLWWDAVANPRLSGHAGGIGDARDTGQPARWVQGAGSAIGRGAARRLADASRARQRASPEQRADARRRERHATPGHVGSSSGLGHLADAQGGGCGVVGREVVAGSFRHADGVGQSDGLADGGARPGPVNGFWADADWLYCRDERWRPVEGGTFPLATGDIARVGRLRAYGNAINLEAATAFLREALA